MQVNSVRMRLFLVVVCAGLAIRFGAYLPYYFQNPEDFKVFPVEFAPNGYHTALTKHFLEYLWYAHTTVIAQHLTDWFKHVFLPPEFYIFVSNAIWNR